MEQISPQVPDGATLKTISVTVGPLSGVSTEALSFCFDDAAAQHGHRGASLEITQRPARVVCIGCSLHYEIENFEELCPQCGSFEREIQSGKEFTVDAIEVEE